MKSLTSTLVLQTDHAPGVLSEVAGVIAAHPANIQSIETLGRSREQATLLLEIERVDDFARLVERLRQLPVVRAVEEAPPLIDIYGKRVIIIGGGAQVGQVAVGAISEADRHNIRGERISVDTIPLVGEQTAGGCRARGRAAAARAGPGAGRRVDGRRRSPTPSRSAADGIIVISLNMAGACPTPPIWW